MAFDQISTSVSIISSGLIGYQGISLTDFTLSSASLIATGSAIEIAGAYFKATVDITPNASSWTAITSNTTAYLTLTASGTAGSQILSAAWTNTAPTWSTSKQGWYASAASVVRVVATAYKNGATSYLGKRILNNEQDILPVKHNWQGEVVLITTGSGLWTVPSDVYKIRVTCVGGGGGGGSFSATTNGTSGSNTTFYTVTGIGGLRGADGGAGSVGIAGSPGQIGLPPGSIYHSGGNGGGNGANSYDTTAGYGGGGVGGVGNATYPGGYGGEGTNISAIIATVLAVIPGQTYSYAVGAGGTGATSVLGNAGDGGSGCIIIEY